MKAVKLLMAKTTYIIFFVGAYLCNIDYSLRVTTTEKVITGSTRRAYKLEVINS